jgi:hypothetical protein
MRTGFLIAALLGCGGSGETPAPAERCDVGSLLEREAAMVAVDCGHVVLAQNNTSAFEAARDCVLAAVAAQVGFRVSWQIQGIDSRIERAIYTDEDLAVFDVIFATDSPGQTGTFAFTSSCETVGAIEPCEVGVLLQDLCLTCVSKRDHSYCDDGEE